MIDRKDLLIIVLIGFFLSVTLYPSITASVGEYDPWNDTNDDGVIDISDLYAEALIYGSSGDPTKYVTVTNFPKANNHLTAILDVQECGGGKDPYVLSASNEITGIGNKTVTFVSGEVSGGTTWSSHTGNWATAGETPGIGRVEVYDSYNTLIAQFVLPLNTMFEVEDVDTIKVYAESPIPKLIDNFGYSAYVMATVYWNEQG